MKEWIDAPAVEVPQDLRVAIGGHPLVAQTLVRRGFGDVGAARAFLDPHYYAPASSYELRDLERAAERLEAGIRAKETVCVWGDFDVDGQTATTVLVSTLHDLEAVVRFYIPHRQRESHGVHLPTLQRLIAEGVDLILTCDTGVTAHEAIAYAQSRGVDVLVTDHHDLPPSLPGAWAVVNPKMLPVQHPLSELPGVGCAYKLAEALYERAGRAAEAEQHLDLVALGIVADLATQVGDTRYLLQHGLEQLRHTERLGLQVLMEAAALNPLWLTEEHIGYEIAPRLNALGRLADANAAIEFFTTRDVTRARTLAAQLEGLNSQRKLLVSQVTQGAVAQIERDPSLLEHGALVLSHDDWPAGILGIVAGRLAERYGRPAVLIATPPGRLARGSARSVPGCNITAAIAAHQEMLERFGGHRMAAGLAMDRERIPAFRDALSDTVGAVLAEVEPPALQIDGTLELEELTVDLVEEIERLAPFGPGNPPLVLVTRDLQVASDRTIGRSGEHLLLTVENREGIAQKVIWWQGAESPLPEERFDLAYVVRASDFRGRREVQVEWVGARPREERPARLRAAPTVMEIVDHRRAPDPRRTLDLLRLEEEVQIWAEATHRAQVGAQDRRNLKPHCNLAIWTAPPSPAVLRSVVQKVQPQKVILFAIDPGLDTPQTFLQRLAGLVKRALSAEGAPAEVVPVNLPELAAATAQREATVRAGLEWLRDRGHIAMSHEEDGEILLLGRPPAARRDAASDAARLESLLAETAAFRSYLRRATAEGVLSILEER